MIRRGFWSRDVPLLILFIWEINREKMEARERKFAGCVFSSGSALILTVVLTSMLAIVGILFVMMARVDKVATSAISENRELDLAIETVIAEISQKLVSDTPGVAGQEYYDCPDDNNAWLASLEPYLFAANDYRWRHITDVNNQLGPGAWDLQAVIVPDYQIPDLIRDSNVFNGVFPADADGDGASDSVWIKLPDMTGSRGQPIYVAVRVVDNQAMLNVNIGFKFDPAAAEPNLIDGSSPLQINVMGLSWRPGLTTYDPLEETSLLYARANYGLGVDPCDLRAYEREVIWRYGRPNGPYTPFDISDELEMRYRYLLNHSDISTRLEGWGGELRNIYMFTTPSADLDEWFISAYDVGLLDPNYAYRHLATTYNMDRIIDPKGGKMIGINDVDNLIGTPHERYSQILPLYFLDMNTPAGILYDRLLSSLVIVDPNIVVQYAQLAANVVDFSDDDDINNDGVLDAGCVTTLVDPYDPCVIHYGFEAQPFINEIAWMISPSPTDNLNFFALELCNPFNVDIDLGNFVLEFVNRNNSADRYSIGFPAGELIKANGYFVIVSQAGRFAIYNDPNTPVTIRTEPALRFFKNWIEADVDKSKPPIDRRPDPDKRKPPIPQGEWGDSYDVSLLRSVLVPVPGTQIYVDNEAIEPNLALPGSTRAFGRDDREWRVIYQHRPPLEDALGGSLGIANYPRISSPIYPYSFFMPNPLSPPARFITVGDIPRILTLGHGTTPGSTIGRQLMAYEQLELSTALDQEHNVRLDVQNPLHRNIFQYLTVFDPNSDHIDNDADGLVDEDDGSEWKIPGRININTAPWYVLAQLPWVSHHTPNYELARAVVEQRDAVGAFGSIGELNFVIDPNDALRSIGYYARTDGPQAGDLLGFPDLTFGDGVEDDFEERDVIFSRVSNLVTVRSDVFTAYILVRIGADGPQKRAVAILDRSGVNKMNFNLPDGKVRVVALHYVPDPR
jgi:hypothetical protein